MYNVVGIKFKGAGKIYYFDPAGLELKKGREVIVQTSRGKEYGTVVLEEHKVDEEDIVLPLKKVLRKATARDKQKLEENKKDEKKAFDICLEKIEKHELPMKLIDVEYTFDYNKIIFYFTADGRVDFRELVKDLAAVFKTRIELRQIGVRDEAKMLGGLGPCGRNLCCKTFIRDFDPISIRMAKAQDLSLSPAKISGICGRLMCCLKYECGNYKEIKDYMPDVGDEVETDMGSGKVIDINVVKKSVTVKLGSNERYELDLDELVEYDGSKVIEGNSCNGDNCTECPHAR